MRKRLRYYFRYLTTPHRVHWWFNWQNLVILLILVGFVVGVTSTKPRSLADTRTGAVQQDALTTLTPAPGPTRAATLSPEYLANSEQTIGVTLAGSLLILIVVIGVLVFMPRHEAG